MAVGHVILGLLQRGAGHGYALRSELESTFGPEWHLDYGHLYRVLEGLHAAGWVRAHRSGSPRGPGRRLYEITARGRVEFDRWLAAPAGTVRGRDELPAQLHFAAARGAVSSTLLDARRQTLETRRHQAEAALRALPPASTAPPARDADPHHPLIAVGSDDPILELLAETVAKGRAGVRMASTPAGSLEGLLALREGRADLAGVHLLDLETGEYNVPFVKHLLPEEPVILVHLARREQGLMLAPGNPKGIRGVRDLGRPGIRLINRQRGAGTRLLLYGRLRQARVSPESILGYDTAVPTHAAVAAAVAAGTADVGPGIRAVAERCGLDFIPLGHEQYDLAIPRRLFNAPRLRPILDVLHRRTFHQRAAALSGYDVTDMSRVVARLT